MGHPGDGPAGAAVDVVGVLWGLVAAVCLAAYLPSLGWAERADGAPTG